MKMSVIICTLNNAKQLDELLFSISDQNVVPKEIIIVHGENDGQTRSVSDYWGSRGLNMVYKRAQRSLVIQRNLGIDSSTGDIICFLDDDVVLESNFFKSLKESYEANDKIGGVQGTITNTMKPSFIKRTYYKIFMLDSIYGYGKLKRSGLPSFHRPTNHTVEVNVFNGCLMSFRSIVLKKYKFDLFFENNWWGDDFETSYNISKEHKLIQIPNARLYHHGNASYSRSAKVAYMRSKNLKYIRKKHGLCRGFNKLFCIWSDLGQVALYFILFLRGEGIIYLKNWIDGNSSGD